MTKEQTQKLKKGQPVRLTEAGNRYLRDNYSAFNAELTGVVVTVAADVASGGGHVAVVFSEEQVSRLGGNTNPFTLNPSYVDLAPLTRADLQAALERAKAAAAEADLAAAKLLKDAAARIQLAEDQITYLFESGATEFDETEFKVWRTLRLVDDAGMKQMDKVRAIAALIKN